MTSSSSEPCPKCLSFLAPKQESLSNTTTDSDTRCCPICLGFWDDRKSAARLLEPEIRRACEPYGNNNRFSTIKDPPVVSLPGDIAARYHMASLLPQYCKTATKTHLFVGQLKQDAQDLISSIIDKITAEQEQSNTKNSDNEYPTCVTQEEQGYLALHVILTTPTSVPRPSSQSTKLQKKGRSRQRHHHYETQGGHPRSNLEQKIEMDSQLAPLWPFSQAVEWTDRKGNLMEKEDGWFVDEQGEETTSIRSLTSANKQNSDNNQNSNNHQILQVHVALWRRAFLVKGNYTKTERDVSQTPFFVDEGKNKRRRLGRTSIEELIMPTLTRICGGISTLNNTPNEKTNVLYGMAKFHASGREDMDVKMILPNIQEWQQKEHDSDNDNNNAKSKITGRPFCCEIIDALRMPTMADLKQVVETINHSTCLSEATSTTLLSQQEQATQQSVSLPLLPESPQYYGQSPLGVGVDPQTLSFAWSTDFKNLQSETESKHKFYACLCWSDKTLPALEVLKELLTTTKSGDIDSNGDGTNHLTSSLFPLELKQKTPIRVLHRRANAVRIRHILSCHRVVRLDDHYFKIHISTDAGTYVKEFCHGDLGRTQPNVSTLLGLGSKIDILELDCEGIKV